MITPEDILEELRSHRSGLMGRCAEAEQLRDSAEAALAALVIEDKKLEALIEKLELLVSESEGSASEAGGGTGVR